MIIELKETKGITLIALVITIIVLLILAGVTISTLFGNEGIIAKAQQAKIETDRSRVQEAVDLWLINNIGEDITKIDGFAKKVTTDDTGNVVYIIQDLSKISTSSSLGKGNINGDNVSSASDLKDIFIIDQENKVSYIDNNGKIYGDIKVIEKVVGLSSDWEIDPQTGTIIKYIGGEFEGDTVVIPNYVKDINTNEEIKINVYGNTAPVIQKNEYIQNKKLKISEGIKQIDYNAFVGNSGFIGDLIIPDTVTTIGKQAFQGCTGFTGDLAIPNSVTTIGFSAFSECVGFSGDLTIPNSVTIIEDGAFQGCTSLTGSLVIPDSVTSIGNGAFYNCTGFTGDLIIGKNVSKIGGSAFGGGFDGKDGFNSVRIKIKDIPNEYFAYNGYIKCKDLILEDSVETIGDKAFYNCPGFTGNLIIGNNVKTIGKESFNSCSGFTGDLIIPDSITTIGGWAFSHCSGFTGDLTIGKGLKSLEDNQFNSCTGFAGTLTVPSTVASINDTAFISFGNGVNLKIGLKNIPSSCFNHSFKGNKLILEDTVQTIGNNAFVGSGIKGELVIPSSVTLIERTAFASCSGLTSIIIKNSQENITLEEYAFSGCVTPTYQ